MIRWKESVSIEEKTRTITWVKILVHGVPASVRIIKGKVVDYQVIVRNDITSKLMLEEDYFNFDEAIKRYRELHTLYIKKRI